MDFRHIIKEMIQFKRYVLVAMILLAVGATASAKLVQTKVYMFGMAASFNDSTAYFTDVQEVDAWINDKGKFLYSRENYSYQLRDYLASLALPFRARKPRKSTPLC